MSDVAVGLLALVFFLPLAAVFGWRKARRYRIAAGDRRRGLASLVLRALFLPALVGAALTATLFDHAGYREERAAAVGWLATGIFPPETGPAAATGGGTVLDASLGILSTLGEWALLFYILTVPFALSGLAAAGFLVADRFGLVDLSRLPEPDANGAAPMPDVAPKPQVPFTVAIDGPAAVGKGTLAKRLSQRYGLPYLDTGLLYRAVGRKTADLGLDLDDPDAAGAVARALHPNALDDGTLRGREAGELASRVAVHASVRSALEAFQRDFAHRPEGAVLDGRDIGTVIAPDAAVKIFVTASAEVRARRRTDELGAKGRAPDYERILAEVRERDLRDAGRSVAPLKPAPDAHLLDTSEMDIDAAFQAACELVDGFLSRRE